VFCLINQYIIL